MRSGHIFILSMFVFVFFVSAYLNGHIKWLNKLITKYVQQQRSKNAR